MDFDTNNPSINSYSQSHRMRSYLWIILSIPLIFNVYSINLEIQEKNTTWLQSISPSSEHFNYEYLLILFAWTLVYFLLLSVHLKWKLSKESFEYSFFPFIRTKSIPLNSVNGIEIIRINPILDFGGWGIRYSRKYGRAYTTSGRHVLHIEYGENKKLNLTVTHPEIAIQKINSIKG